jgi:hypothetical protein
MERTFLLSIWLETGPKELFACGTPQFGESFAGGIRVRPNREMLSLMDATIPCATAWRAAETEIMIRYTLLSTSPIQE